MGKPWSREVSTAWSVGETGTTDVDYFSGYVVDDDRLPDVGVHVTSRWIPGGFVDGTNLFPGPYRFVDLLRCPTAASHLPLDLRRELERLFGSLLDDLACTPAREPTGECRHAVAQPTVDNLYPAVDGSGDLHWAIARLNGRVVDVFVATLGRTLGTFPGAIQSLPPELPVTPLDQQVKTPDASFWLRKPVAGRGFFL